MKLFWDLVCPGHYKVTMGHHLLLRSPSSVQFSHSVVSDSVTPWIAARPPCPSPTPGVHSNSCPSSWSCHPAICRPLLLLPPIPPSIRVFSNESALCMKWPKYWSFSFSISPSNEHPGLISFRWTGWISLQYKGLSRVFSNTTVQKHQFFGAQLSSQVTQLVFKSLSIAYYLHCAWRLQSSGKVERASQFLKSAIKKINK